MNILLISVDEKLQQLCRRVVQECIPTNCFISEASSFSSNLPADATIVDCIPDLDIPDVTVWENCQTLFIIDRQLLPQLSARLPLHSANILLKPVNEAMLRIFTEHMIARHRAASQAKEGQLKEERDQILQSLLKANLTLQEYDQDRTNFLARSVHDFRAPLTALQGYCGLLLEEGEGPLNSRQLDLVKGMHRSAKRLSTLATSLFELSIRNRVERGPNLQRIDIGSCIGQAIHEVAPLASEKNIEIRADVQEPRGAVMFEPGQMEQVLINLLENACKFTPKRGLVEITGYPVAWSQAQNAMDPCSDQEEADAYRVDVSDSGPGVLPEYRDRIFEEYTSYGGGRDRSGGGLGLAICRMILESHQGRIWADSKRQGATFSFVVRCMTDAVTKKPNQGEDLPFDKGCAAAG
jgi:signal transduction histidine kinase